jgi:hypothetical protein
VARVFAYYVLVRHWFLLQTNIMLCHAEAAAVVAAACSTGHNPSLTADMFPLASGQITTAQHD